MSAPIDPIRKCLDKLSKGIDLVSAIESFPAPKDSSLEDKTQVFVNKIFEDYHGLQDKDLEALSKIHADPILSPELSKKIFVLCLTHLGHDIHSRSDSSLHLDDIENLETRKKLLAYWQKDVLDLEALLPLEMEATERFQLSVSFLQNLIDAEARKTLISTLADLPSEHRQSFLKAAITLTQGTTQSLNKQTIIEEILSFKPGNYYELALKIAPIVNQFEYKNSLIRRLSKINEKDFDAQLHNIACLLDNINDTVTAENIIDKAIDLYESGDHVAIKNAIFLSEKKDSKLKLLLLDNPYQREITPEMRLFLSNFQLDTKCLKPLVEAAEILSPAIASPISTILSAFKSQEIKFYVVDRILSEYTFENSSKSQEKTKKMALHFPSLIKVIDDKSSNTEEQLIGAFDALFSNPPEEWEDICKSYLALSNLFHSSIKRAVVLNEILTIFAKMPIAQHKEFILLAKEVLPFLDNSKDLLKLLKNLSCESLKDRVQYIDTLKKVIPHLIEPLTRQEILVNLSAASASERKNIIKFVNSIEPFFSHLEIVNLILNSSLKALPEIDAFIEWGLPLLKRLSDDMRYHSVFYLSYIPVEDRSPKVLDLIEKLSVSNPYFSYYSASLLFIAPEKRVAALKETLDLIEAGSTLPSNIIEMISRYYADSETLTKSHQYLLNEIISNPNKERGLSIANNVFRYKNLLKVTDDSPLFQYALYCYHLIQRYENTPHDPYIIFAYLKKQPSQNADIKPPAETVDGIKVQFSNRHFIEELEKSKARATFDTLPPHINSELLKSYFRVLKERIASLPEDKKVATLTEIYNQTGLSLEALETNLAKDPYINGLLDKTGTKDMKAPPEIIELKALIEDLETLSNEPKEPDLLSQREEALIQMSNSIQHCPGGKREGIASLYRIRKGMTLSLSSHASDPYGQANAYVTSLVTQWMNTSISEDGPLMRELTKTPSSQQIEQLSHQSIFIKNLIAGSIGLDWNPSFDLFANHVSDPLLKTSQNDVISAFYRHFTPTLLIENFKSHVDKVLSALNTENKDKNKQAAALYHLLSKLMSDDPSIWELTETFEEETATFVNSCKLTESGALKVLLKIGILEAPSAPSAAG